MSSLSSLELLMHDLYFLSLFFRPPFLMHNCHIQTLLPMFLPCPTIQQVVFQRTYLLMKDRGIVALDWAQNPRDKTQNVMPNRYKRFGTGGRRTNSMSKHKTIVIILPGIQDGCDNVAHLCVQSMERGFRPIVFHRYNLYFMYTTCTNCAECHCTEYHNVCRVSIESLLSVHRVSSTTRWTLYDT